LGIEVPETEADFFAALETIKADGSYLPMAMGTNDQWEAACLMFFSGFHAKREPLPGTLYMPDSGGGWIVNRLVFEDRVVV
jgi:hypothetical protein